MSTYIAPSELTADQQAELDTPHEYREPPKKSPQVERLESHVGFHERAQRLLYCNKLGRYLRCKKGHISKRVFSCGLRFCPVCSINLAEIYFERVLPAAKAIQKRCIAERSKVVELYFSVACERSQTAMEGLIASIAKRFSDAGVTCPIYLHFTGFQYNMGEDRAIVRVLLGGTQWRDWKQMFDSEGWELCSHSLSQSHLIIALRRIVQPLSHLSPVEMADHEVLFNRFHAHRIYNMPELSVGELESTESSTQKGCPQCGEPWIEVSQVFALCDHVHIPDLKTFHWSLTDPLG